jgi:hypothetical protein
MSKPRINIAAVRLSLLKVPGSESERPKKKKIALVFGKTALNQPQDRPFPCW